MAKVLFDYGELRNAKILARTIVNARSENKLVTTQDLITVVQSLVPQRIENKILAQLFQAIRIEVNNELEVLQSFLN